MYYLVSYGFLVTVDQLDPTPLYEQLASILRGMIRSGELQPGRPVPSETTLQQQHGISRGTVRMAVGLLRDEGLVITIKGRGTFVRSSGLPGRVSFHRGAAGSQVPRLHEYLRDDRHRRVLHRAPVTAPGKLQQYRLGFLLRHGEYEFVGRPHVRSFLAERMYPVEDLSCPTCGNDMSNLLDYFKVSHEMFA